MFLALREMRRAKVRFSLLTGAVGLLVFLILFQKSLQNGLLTSFVGGVRNQSAPVLVYSVDGQRFIQGSVITPDQEALIAEASGIGESGRLAQGTFTVRTDVGTFDASVIGYERDGLGSPSTLIEGRMPATLDEAVASDADAADGFDVGDVVTIEPGGLEITVVGLARDVQLNAGPSLFVSYDTYVEAVLSRNPDAGEPLPNVIALRPADGVSAQQLVANVNTLSDDLDALTRRDAADKAPGVAQVRSSFLIIFMLYGLVVPCVTGLFFLIITFQKANSLTLLRAIGAPARRLVAALLIQVVVIVGAGYLIGLAMYTPVSAQRLGGIPLRFETAAVVFWALLLLALAVLSSLVSARRVLQIDPIEATHGAVTR
jgi:putative ABC transport system permease protein